MRQAKEEKDEGHSSSGSRIGRKIKPLPPNFQIEPDELSTSSSSLELLRESGDQAAMNFREKRNSASTLSSTEHAANLSSRASYSSARASLFIDSAQDIGTNSADDLDNSKEFIGLSETRIVSSSNLWIKEIMTKSSHSKHSGRGSRTAGQPRERKQRRGSNSIRSMGSQNVSRSSHGSISIHTMASSMDSGTDSDLDHEILSDDGSDDNNFDQDEEYLTESESDDDISEDDGKWRAKSMYERIISKKLSASPKQATHNVASRSQMVERIGTSPSDKKVDTSTKLLSPTTESPVKELRFSTQSEQESSTNGSKQDLSSSSTSPRENSDAKGKNNVIGGILRNSFTSTNAGSKVANRYLEESNGAGNESSNDSKTELDSSPPKRQVLWAEKLKEEYSHRSMNGMRKETMSQDYEMPLKKMPPSVLKRSNADAFFNMLQNRPDDILLNPTDNRRGSLSSESLNTLNSLCSSNRQDSLSDVFEISSTLIDSGRDTRIVEVTSGSLSNHQNCEDEYIEVELNDEKNGAIDWEKVNKGLNLNSRVENNDVIAMERGQRYSFSETEPELSEDFYDSFFAPREDGKSAGSPLDLGKVPPKSVKRQSRDKITTSGRDQSMDSHLMEYSVSQSLGHLEPAPVKAGKSNLLPDDRKRRHIVSGIFALLILLAGGLILYFFVRPDPSVDEEYPEGIDTLFLVDP
eukprot:CAMPEP_0116134108 /NCGR_PEP_ID=MMETSP0329-20121206/10472_1 /TAXON_ID=697910 /ORGANISM="Pseudo-nitzschia arenysensis, Strain B593" /LENGTH=692 /DNA_ID=CAMNT_0003628801 /DNA_START=49 /DNA_END=2127 /DNA_ORIENTATION=-